MIEKHLYKRSVVKNGKKITVWYYWFWHEGKQVRRSCGQRGKPCTTKKDAMAFLMTLDDADLIPSTKILVRSCDGMFDHNSEYMRRLAAKGRIIHEHTRRLKAKTLTRIIEQFGDRDLREIIPVEVDRWVLSLDLSNSSRNNIVEVFGEVFHNAYYLGLIDSVPVLDKYARIDTKSKGILTMQEIRTLFPNTVDEIIDVWSVNSTDRYETFQTAVMILVLLTTGMRSGEVRALQYHQRIRPDVFLLNAMIDSNDERVDHLKMGKNNDKKWRVAIMPEFTVRMLDALEAFPERLGKTTDYIFEHNGDFVPKLRMGYKFKRVLDHVGIDAKARNISVHSTRFTYNSIMRREIAGDDLRLMLGHSRQTMTDYYDKSTVLDNLPALLTNKNSIENVWSL